jgi:hypothetical protein
LNGSNKNKPIITRAPPPPPTPKPTSTISDDLLLIDFSDLSPQKPVQRIEANTSFEQIIPTHRSPIIEHSHSLSYTQPKFSSNVIDPQQFVAKVVSGVTEQLKHDFPRSNSTKKDFTPPLVRRFTVPYPSNQTSYYNTHRQE